QEALCSACNDRQLTALVASLSGRMLDGAAGIWAPVRPPEIDPAVDVHPVKPVPAEPTRATQDLQLAADRLRTGLDQLGGQVQKMSTQLEKATSKAEQLSAKVSQPSIRP